MGAVKVHELRSKSAAELNKQVAELRRDLLNLRVKQQSGQTQQKSLDIRNARRSIAKVLTVINQSAKAALREKYAGKKYLPLELRAKRTRAIRRALTKSERNKKTQRQIKRAAAFPVRKYAVMQ